MLAAPARGLVVRRRVMVLGFVGVLVAVLGVGPSGARPDGAADAAARLHAAGRWLVDGQGRAVVLHGVNQVSKLPPYLPSAIGFGADDAAAIADLGFNTVRTGIAHAGLAPAPGAYDTDYLDAFVETVDALTGEGLYVLVDVHQDMFNERYQGNGFADWMTADSVPGDPTALPSCNLGFPGNYFACSALWETYDRFFGLAGRDPEVGPRGRTLQDEFAEAWEVLAAPLADDPRVFGFDVLNEPVPGSQVLPCLEPAGCLPTTDAQLTAFHELVAPRIRAVAPDTMVFYEPWSTNFNAGFPTYHGDLSVDDLGLSFHVYACPFAIPGVPVPDPGLSEHCDDLREQTVFDNAEAQAERYGHPPLVTEFGATEDIGTISTDRRSGRRQHGGLAVLGVVERRPLLCTPRGGHRRRPGQPADPGPPGRGQARGADAPLPPGSGGHPDGLALGRRCQAVRPRLHHRPGGTGAGPRRGHRGLGRRPALP